MLDSAFMAILMAAIGCILIIARNFFAWYERLAAVYVQSEKPELLLFGQVKGDPTSYSTRGIPLRFALCFGFLIAISCAVAGFALSLAVLVAKIDFEHRWKCVQGQVVKVERRRGERTTLEYRYQVDDQTFFSDPIYFDEKEESDLAKSYHPGQQVEIRYEPDKPRRSHILSPRVAYRDLAMSLFLLAVGITARRWLTKISKADTGM